jgi:phosphomannomutase
MTLIKSISGIRGTIGGAPGEGLTPLDIVRFTAAYARFIRKRSGHEKIRLVVGRDARPSGEMVQNLVTGTLIGCGADVVNLSLATTPTVEMTVTQEEADGGLIITASHNPGQWNALKMLNRKGEFLNAEDGREILEISEQENFHFVPVAEIGKISYVSSHHQDHINAVLELPLVDVEAIKKARLRVVIDCVNSVGGIILPHLLEQLGVEEVIELNCKPDGQFAHNPEPLPANLTEISERVKLENAHLGLVVDPDVDRLAIINEDGSMFGEEYTLVAVADYVLKHKSGNTVSNMSSTRALRDLTESYGGLHFSAPVGEVNVVEAMKANDAVIGGEGNGGVIYPELHYGRDALVGAALFLSHLAKSEMSCSQMRRSFPEYVISKNKIALDEKTDPDKIFSLLKEKYKTEHVDDSDGLKIDFASEWVQLRKSNTEPIIRIYAESKTEEAAQSLAQKLIKEVEAII